MLRVLRPLLGLVQAAEFMTSRGVSMANVPLPLRKSDDLAEQVMREPVGATGIGNQLPVRR